MYNKGFSLGNNREFEVVLEREKWLRSMYYNRQLRAMSDVDARRFLTAGQFLPEIVEEFLTLRRAMYKKMDKRAELER